MRSVRALILAISLLLVWEGVAYPVSISPDAVTATNVSVSCGTTATVLLAANGRRRSWVTVAPPTNTATAYVGFSNTGSTAVTTSNGLPLNANNTISDSTYVGVVYCIVASGTVTLLIAETAR